MINTTMDARDNIAQDLFYKIRSRFSGLKLGKETGEITIMPNEARFFDFDYQEESKAIGHVSISLAEPNSMKVYFSNGITESMDNTQKTNWYRFLKELRNFAKRRLLAFDTRDIAKDNLDQRDYAFLSKNAQPKPADENTIVTTPVGEAIMSESAMYGTKNVSYQKLMDTRLIVKHSQSLQDDIAPGARSRNISALFVENQDGERFKYPFVHLAGARAMQRHVANNGLPYDDVGKSIIEMSEQIAQLKSFSNYVVRNDLMNSDTNSIVERSGTALNSLREQISKLAKQAYYEAYKENFQTSAPIEVPDEVVEDFTEKFTVKNFKEDLRSVFPVLYKLMQEESTIGYDDIVEMTAEQEETNEDVELDTSYDPFEQFESWVMGLGEDSAITSEDAEERTMAVQQLQKLMNEEFPAGVDGSNAIESIKGIIEDPSLFKEIKDAASENPQADIRPLVRAWMEQNAQEALEDIDFGNTSLPGEEETQEADSGPKKSEIPAFMRKAKGGDDWKMSSKDVEDEKNQSPTTKIGLEKRKQQLDIKEVAEFINSFYDRNTGTFPKGPEGVCTMVGKKFGEQAESAARQFVERMAPEQSTEQNPELQELARIRELSGIGQGNETYDRSMDPEARAPRGRNIDPDDRDQEPVGYGSGAALQRSPEEQEEFEKMMRYIERGGYNNNKKVAENPELESVKRVSGISQGLGF